MDRTLRRTTRYPRIKLRIPIEVTRANPYEHCDRLVRNGRQILPLAGETLLAAFASWLHRLVR
jgi:hypothetical protein